MLRNLLCIPHQIPALFVALRASYGVVATPSQAARAARLAPTVQAIHPGIYRVGSCQVNKWQSSCTCQAHRTRALAGMPFSPCAHFLALYLAGEWSPIYDGILYLQSVDVEEPEAIATYCHVKGRRGAYRVTGTYRQLPANPLWVELADLTGEAQAPARLGECHRLTTIYA
jgi:hypothetical protein